MIVLKNKNNNILNSNLIKKNRYISILYANTKEKFISNYIQNILSMKEWEQVLSNMLICGEFQFDVNNCKKNFSYFKHNKDLIITNVSYPRITHEILHPVPCENDLLFLDNIVPPTQNGIIGQTLRVEY